MTRFRFESWLPSHSVRRGHEHVFVPRYTEAELREVVARSKSLSEVLRHFDLRPAGGNHKQLRRWLERWDIPFDHFTLEWPQPRGKRTPLSAILVEGSTFSRGHLKERLYAEGLKERRCELCGQDEHWRGQPMSLILDHINGVADDNPDREPADRLPQLRGDVRDALRPTEPSPRGAHLRVLRPQLRGQAPAPAFLLAS